MISMLYVDLNGNRDKEYELNYNSRVTSSTDPR